MPRLRECATQTALAFARALSRVCAAGSASTPMVLGPPQASAGCTPEDAEHSRSISVEDRDSMALVASLWEELAALYKWGMRLSALLLGVIFVVSGALSRTRCWTMSLSRIPLVTCLAP